MSDGGENLMTLSEVARAFGVDPGTVIVWGKRGYLTAIRDSQGRPRFRADEIATIIAQGKHHGR
jgi:predicted site-specific integrase-resolvase